MKTVVYGTLAGILGVVVALAALHLWQDHQMLHVMAGWINQQIVSTAQSAGK